MIIYNVQFIEVRPNNHEDQWEYCVGSTPIAGYAQQDQYPEAFQVFGQMQGVGLKLNYNRIPYLSILNGCASPAALDGGKKTNPA